LPVGKHATTDRLGSIPDISSTILMLERQRDGIIMSKAKGRYKGRKSNFTNEVVQNIKDEFAVTKNKAKLARNHGISRGYLYQLVKDAV
jgi:DNA invertase Pin-like site-specific DNA recombinase